MQEFYKINQIASLFGISCDTLRLYEKTGLLSPSFVSESNKYRYYGLKEILKLDYIIQLKNIGYTLSEIKKAMSSKLDLHEKRKILEYRYNNLQKLLSVYDDLMNVGEYDIEIKTYPEHYALKKDVRVQKWEELIGVYAELVHKVINDNCTLNTSSNPYAIFNSNFSINNFACTACLHLNNKKSNDAVFCPEQSFICLKFKGDYSNLQKAYERLYAYAEENNIPLLSYTIERYIVAYDNSPLSSSFITEINLPIA